MYAAMPQSMLQAYRSNPAEKALLVKRHLLDGADNIRALDGLVANSRRLNAYGAVRGIRAAACAIDFINQDVAISEIITSYDNICVKNVTITSGATLTLIADNDINVQNVTVTNNSRLILYAGGRVNLGTGFRVEPGSSFSIR